MKSKTETS